MGGVGYAALKGKDKKKVRAIADQEITKQAPGLSVANAARANAQRGQARRNSCGRRPEVLQRRRESRRPPSSTRPGASDTSFTNVPGFNCFQPGNLTSSVQLERLAQGQYFVRFVGNSGPNASGSAQASMVSADGYVNYVLADPSPIPGENVFQVIVHNAAGNVVDNRTFSLLAF